MLKTRLQSGLFTNPLKHIWQDYSHMMVIRDLITSPFVSIFAMEFHFFPPNELLDFWCVSRIFFSRGNGRLNLKTFFAPKTFSISKKPREQEIARAIAATCCSFFFFLLQQFYIVAVHFFEYFTMCIEKRSISRMWAQ